MNEIIRPQHVEKKLMRLYEELDLAHKQLVDAEFNYHTFKADAEIALAKGRMYFRGAKRVQEVEDQALLMCETELKQLAIAEALAKSARANAARLRTQVDIVRSVGTSVRAAMDLD